MVPVSFVIDPTGAFILAVWSSNRLERTHSLQVFYFNFEISRRRCCLRFPIFLQFLLAHNRRLYSPRRLHAPVPILANSPSSSVVHQFYTFAIVCFDKHTGLHFASSFFLPLNFLLFFPYRLSFPRLRSRRLRRLFVSSYFVVSLAFPGGGCVCVFVSSVVVCVVDWSSSLLFFFLACCVCRWCVVGLGLFGGGRLGRCLSSFIVRVCCWSLLLLFATCTCVVVVAKKALFFGHYWPDRETRPRCRPQTQVLLQPVQRHCYEQCTYKMWDVQSASVSHLLRQHRPCICCVGHRGGRAPAIHHIYPRVLYHEEPDASIRFEPEP